MRKHITRAETQGNPSDDVQSWLDLEHLVQIELTSEDAEHQIESALINDAGSGWRAQLPGKQKIRLLFDKPRRISRIQLIFQEDARARTQEFVLRWSPEPDTSYREIVRQQYNFSPPTVTRELEDYAVDLDGLKMLELEIIPDISGEEILASLAQLRLA